MFMRGEPGAVPVELYLSPCMAEIRDPVIARFHPEAVPTPDRSGPTVFLQSGDGRELFGEPSTETRDRYDPQGVLRCRCFASFREA